jgi:hypothetical protein
MHRITDLTDQQLSDVRFLIKQPGAFKEQVLELLNSLSDIVGLEPTSERFTSRGMGLDNTPGCFICGGEPHLYNNISGFVESKEAGERIVALFPKGARLDYRPSEPKWIQVKIGACDKHKAALISLHDKSCVDCKITSNMVNAIIAIEV